MAWSKIFWDFLRKVYWIEINMKRKGKTKFGNPNLLEIWWRRKIWMWFLEKWRFESYVGVSSWSELLDSTVWTNIFNAVAEGSFVHQGITTTTTRLRFPTFGLHFPTDAVPTCFLCFHHGRNSTSFLSRHHSLSIFLSFISFLDLWNFSNADNSIPFGIPSIEWGGGRKKKEEKKKEEKKKKK